MAKKKSGRRKPAKKSKPRPKKHKSYFLDVLNVEAIRKGRAFGEQIARLYWELYCELAFQRSQAADKIAEWARSVVTGPHEFSTWRRVVRYQFANDPLSVEGSVRSVGGRFNIGDIDTTKFPTFPALYVASDQSTALAETFGQPKTVRSDLTALDMALASVEPYACVTVKGRLDEIIDLRVAGVLDGLAEINKSFTISKQLAEGFKKAGWPPQDVIPNSDVMLKSVLDERWRIYPMQFDVPSNSQILGQIASGAGVHGILYPSTKHSGECLGIYPQNFSGTDSYIEIEGVSPDTVRISRLGATVAP